MSDFKLDSLLVLTAETGYAGLASASVTRILYKKPGGPAGYWNATVSGTTLVYNVQPGDIDKDGIWQFQSYILVGGLEKKGEIYSHNFAIPLL